MEGEINTSRPKNCINPTDRFFIGEIIADRRKVDEFEEVAFGERPDMRMAVENGFHVTMGLDDFEKAIGIEQFAITLAEGVMDEDDGWRV